MGILTLFQKENVIDFTLRRVKPKTWSTSWQNDSMTSLLEGSKNTTEFCQRGLQKHVIQSTCSLYSIQFSVNPGTESLSQHKHVRLSETEQNLKGAFEGFVALSFLFWWVMVWILDIGWRNVCLHRYVQLQLPFFNIKSEALF